MEDLNYNHLIELLYCEYSAFGKTDVYERFYNKLTDGKSIEEEISDELTHAVNAECFQAFKAGFKAAVELMK